MESWLLKSRIGSNRRSEMMWGLIFISPWILSFAVFTLYPFLSGLKTSFLDFSVFTPERTRFAALDNYSGVLADKLFWKSILNVVYNQAVFIPLSIGCALFFAFILSEVKKGAAIYKMCYYIPLIVSLVVASLIFNQLVDQKGPIQKFLFDMGIIHKYSSVQEWTWQAMPIVALFNTWKWFGVMMIYFIAGLAGIDSEIVEAAYVDGAGWWKRAVKIRLPLLWPQIFFFITMNIINGLQMFTEVLMIFNISGGMHKQGMTPSLMLYTQAFSYDNMGYAATIGIMLSFLIFIVNQTQMKLMGEGRKKIRVKEGRS